MIARLPITLTIGSDSYTVTAAEEGRADHNQDAGYIVDRDAMVVGAYEDFATLPAPGTVATLARTGETAITYRIESTRASQDRVSLTIMLRRE